ncbi:MAG: hypothetical protein J6K88_05155 [Oscillospiraceae bacterium]|nr:hypothetical protein [Oscillospiraceae bacterium]
MKFCTYCGKEIADEAVICLGCGCNTQKANSFTSPRATAPPQEIIIEDTEPQLATWAKICGIVSFFIGWFALGITAIVLACMSKDETNGTMCSSAKVGYVCGIVSTALSFILLIVFVAFITYLSI